MKIISIVTLLGASLLLSACTSNPLSQPEFPDDDVLGFQQTAEEANRQIQDLDLSQAAQTQEALPTEPEPTIAKTIIQPGDSMQATIKTKKGSIVLTLFSDKAPNTVQNFVDKAKSGYYDGLTFHRVEDWVIQGGDPIGNGTGGGKMPTELNDEAFVEGSLGVARGPDIKVSNDSQFFVCTTDCAWLTGQYTNFGQVTDGMDVAKTIAIGDTIESITITQE